MNLLLQVCMNLCAGKAAYRTFSVNRTNKITDSEPFREHSQISRIESQSQVQDMSRCDYRLQKKRKKGLKIHLPEYCRFHTFECAVLSSDDDMFC